MSRRSPAWQSAARRRRDYPISSLFVGRVGAFFAADQISAAFRDTAETVPFDVNDWGFGVASLRSIDGQARQAQQATSGFRPKLGRIPATGRRNLLTNSGFAGAATGTPGTVPNGWTLGFGTGSIAAIAADAALGGSSVTVSATAARHLFHQLLNAAPGTTWMLSADVVVSQPVAIEQIIVFASQPADATQTFYLDGAQVTNGAQVPAGAHKVAVKLILTATAGTSMQARVGIGCAGTATGTVKISNPQLEAGGSITAYQLVVSAQDVTEAGYRHLLHFAHDMTDDVLVAALPNLGTAAMVAIASSAGVEFLSGQTISGAYNLPARARCYGWAVANLAWSAAEQAIITEIFTRKGAGK